MTSKPPCDPALYPMEDAGADSAVQEVTSPEDRATGARVINSPQWHGAAVVKTYTEPLVGPGGEQYTPTLDELARDLKAKFEKVQNGDLADPEAMLLAQAVALQAVFSALALKALDQTGLSAMQMCMSVALKAQAQSRATLTALADMKHPRQPNYIGQQNIAATQQVNNSLPATLGAAPIERPPIKLLETANGERLDGRTQGATSRANYRMEAMAEVKRAKDGGRQSEG